MALRLRDFTSFHRRALRQSCRVVERRLARPPGPIPRDLAEALQAMLSGARPVVDLVYGGGNAGGQTPYARSTGYRISVYEKAFAEEGRRGARLAAVLFHELIHVARGWELDAEAFENAWFTAEEGARPPSADDWTIFKNQRYQGWWVRLDSRTRRVTDYADRFIVTFPRRLGRSRR
jgi:hypothetical protein